MNSVFVKKFVRADYIQKSEYWQEITFMDFHFVEKDKQEISQVMHSYSSFWFSVYKRQTACSL